jgi:1,4-alpha-glucan branching enzyme
MKWLKISLIISLAFIFYSCGGSVRKTQVTDNSTLKPGIYKFNNSVTFIYQGDLTNITSVALTGDFNSWNAEGIPLNMVNSNWVVTLTLEYGIYQYKYIINKNKMVPDPSADAYAPDGKGGKNSIIEVKKE